MSKLMKSLVTIIEIKNKIIKLNHTYYKVQMVLLAIFLKRIVLNLKKNGDLKVNQMLSPIFLSFKITNNLIYYLEEYY